MKKVLTLLILFAFLGSCSEDNSPNAIDNLNLSISGLEDLGIAAQYEGWIIVDGAPVSTGTFQVDAGGALSTTAFTVSEANLDAATKFVLTVEPIPDTDPMPSDQKLLAGDFSGNSTTLSTGTAPALGSFENAAGTLFLRTPTDEMPGSTNNMNDMYGVWFGTPGMPPGPGLTLPTLPTGWAYEGWVVGDSGPISTGTFTAFGVRDDSNGFSGTENNAGPPIPGEDFFNNAPAGETFPLDVRGRAVVISVEPVPDNSPAPFLLKPLLLNVPSDAATAPTTHNFMPNLGSLPTGTVTRQ